MATETLTLTRERYEELLREIEHWKGAAERRRIAIETANRHNRQLEAERNAAWRRIDELRTERDEYAARLYRQLQQRGAA